MRYELDATDVAVDPQMLFIGFTNKNQDRYFWLQREEGTFSPTPSKEDIWVERDDQAWGGPGGLGHTILSRDRIQFHLAREFSKHLGDFDDILVNFTLPDSEYDQLRRVLQCLMEGYESDLTIES